MKNLFKKKISNVLLALPLLIFATSEVKSAQNSPQAKVIKIATKGDQLSFDKTNLLAKSNQSIKLTFKNKSAQSAGLEHNWVLVKIGKADKVAADSISSGEDKGWLAESSDVLAHTKLLKAGESETIEFSAPATPGDYPYFCSFPGHAQTMKGTFHVH